MRQSTHITLSRARGSARWLLALVACGASSLLLGCSVYGPGLLGTDDAGLLDEAGSASELAAGNSESDPRSSSGGTAGVSSDSGSGASSLAGTPGASAGGAGGTGGANGGSGTTAWAGAPSTGQSGAASGGGGSGGVQAGMAFAGSSGAGNTAGQAGPAVIELAQNKPAVASSSQAGHSPSSGNDGNGDTRWCSKDDTYPQWWRVDLGARHRLSDFSVSFQHPERKYMYQIETSTDDSVYVVRANIDGIGAVHSGNFQDGLTARYVRITVTDGVDWVQPDGTVFTTWATFFEFSVKGW